MKKSLPLILACGLVPLTVTHLPAAELLNDDFSYADGDLVGNGLWTNHSGSGSLLQVSGGTVSVVHGGGSREDANATFTEQTTGEIYYGIDFAVADLGGPYPAGSDNEYFVHFRPTTGFEFRGRVSVGPPASTGDFSIGLATDSGGATATWAADLTFGVTYRLVVSYDLDADNTKLWIDPAAESDASISGVVGSGTAPTSSIALRQSNSDGDETITVDNLIVGTTFADALGTPPTESLSVSLSTMSVAENSGSGVVDVTLTRSGATTSALDVILSSGDSSEATIPVSPLQIPVGQASETFAMAIDAVDDNLVDGPQDVTITASASGYVSGQATLTVTDAGDSYSLIVNEVYYAPDPTTGDVNGDGSVNNADEFIEIMNVSGMDLDLSAYTVNDGFGTIHTFPVGTVLKDNCAILIFGGAGVTEGSTADFGEAQVQISTNNGLFLNDDGDTITILDDSSTPIFVAALPDVSADPTQGSLNLAVDGNGGSGYGRHAALTGLPAEQFSPGTNLDGTPFCDLTNAIMVSANPAMIGEDGAAASVTLTITLPAPSPGGPLFPGEYLYVSSGDTTELVVDPIGGNQVLVLQGETTGTITLDPVNDTDVDGTQSVTITVSGSGYLNGTVTIDVTDDGDLPLEGDLFFSEYAEGTSNNKYLEIFNPTVVTLSLDGYAFPSVSNAPDNGAGNYDFWNTFEAGATIGPGEVYIIAHPSADQSILDVANETFSFLSNGDDGFALVKGTQSSFTVIDWIGDWNGDPGSGWDVAGVTNGTQNHTLVRKNSVTEGNTDWDQSRGTTAEDSEWIVRDVDDWTSLGVHPNSEAVPLLITGSSFNFTTNELVLTISGLQAGTDYAVESSTDLDQADFWEGLVLFDTTGSIVPGVTVVETPVSSGIYVVTIPDLELATETTNYYRVSAQ